MKISKKKQATLRFRIGETFNPSAPIDEKELFAGRKEQIFSVIDAISQRGQHTILYGERGVGKTSLANVLHSFLEGLGKEVLAPRINCYSTDTFSTLWRKVFSEIELSIKTRKVGFTSNNEVKQIKASDFLPEDITPDDVRKAFVTLPIHDIILIVILDEFDRLEDETTKKLCADTMKILSDHSVNTTIVLVGVADSVEQLIQEHLSIERALVQIRLPRMTTGEIKEIIKRGLRKIGMQTDQDASNRIALLSQGLPYFTHLLCLQSCFQAIEDWTEKIEIAHVDKAIRIALDNAQQSILTAYHKATSSSRKETLYSRVLLACALSKRDELGYFAAGDVRDPMSKIMGKQFEIPSFSRHLHDFCDETRGFILQKSGKKHRLRFRFSNPLMQPFVVMRGLDKGKISSEILKHYEVT